MKTLTMNTYYIKLQMLKQKYKLCEIFPLSYVREERQWAEKRLCYLRIKKFLII